MTILRLLLVTALAGVAGCSSSTPGSPAPGTGPDTLAVDVVATGLDLPLRLVAPPGDPRLFIVEQGGLIRIFTRDGTDRGVFLDLTAGTTASGERGLLGLAFPPDYAASGRFYVNYTDQAGDSRVVRYRVDGANPDRADAGSAEELLMVDQPFANHNGGMLAFGPDGMLYVGFGDGGSGGDPGNRAQDGGTLLGKLLRLDVSTETGYAVPPDNPFVGRPPRDEIWALGLRNPWVFTFDAATGDLWIADVGQGEREEIDHTPAGAGAGLNYGWRLMEGTACFNPSSGCVPDTLVLPVYEYSHGGTPFRCSISGGHVYRGAAIRSLVGRYVFADYCSNQVWALTPASEGVEPAVEELTDQLQPPDGYGAIAGIGCDADGELYVLDIGAGVVARIVVR